MKSEYKLNGTIIRRPKEFKIERFNVTKAERLADGSMSMDLIAKKRKFYFTWDAISASDMNKILDLIWETSAVFFTLTYIESNVTKSAVVYTGSMPSTLYRTDDGDWVWTDVTINFIER